VIANAITARYSSQQVEEIRQQIAALERAIPDKEHEEAKLKQAYLAGAYSAEEFALERKRLLQERELLRSESAQLHSQILLADEVQVR